MTSDLWARLFRSSEPVASSSASCLRLPKYKARSVAMMAFLMISSTCSYSLEVRLEKILCPSSYGKKEINKKAKAPLMESGSPGELQQSRMGIQEMAVNQLTLLKMGHFLNMGKKLFFFVVDLMRTAISTNSGGMFALITCIDLKINGTTTWMLPCISASVNMALKENMNNILLSVYYFIHVIHLLDFNYNKGHFLQMQLTAFGVCNLLSISLFWSIICYYDWSYREFACFYSKIIIKKTLAVDNISWFREW